MSSAVLRNAPRRVASQAPWVADTGAGSMVEGQLPRGTTMRSFKFRSRVGHDVAVEALREAIRRRKATPAEVMQWARVDRVGAVVRPTSKRCSDAEAGHQHRRIGSAAAAQP